MRESNPADAATAGVAIDAATRSEAASFSTPDAAHPDADAVPVDRGVDAGARERSGDFAVGTRRIEIATDTGRVLPVQLWYPALDVAAAEADAGHGIEVFEAPGPRRELLTSLIADAREDCPNLLMHAAIDATAYPRSTPLPLIVYSHHFNGSRFSMFSIAEGLAREGMVVAAPDHVNGSLFERVDVLTDMLSQFSDDFMQTRVADLRRVLDVLLDASSEAVPPGLRGRFDPARVGAIGHSLGAMTVGILSVDDERVRASAYLGAPPSSDVAALAFTLPNVERFRTPGLYLAGSEDLTVALLGGSEALAANFQGQALPAYWIDVRATGHFSFADDCGLVPEFDEGCGTGTSITNGESFTYVDVSRAREIGVHYSTLFFSAQLQDAPATKLSEALPAELVTVKQHGAQTADP